MNHQLCPRWNVVGAIQGARGTGRERIDKGTREKGVFPFLPPLPASWQSVQPPWNVFPGTFSLATRGKGHTMRKKKIPMSVAGKEESNSYRSLPESSNFLLENNVSSILANVAYITCIYMRERIASRVWKSWENGPRSRNKCLRRTWLHVHVYRRNGREHC